MAKKNFPRSGSLAFYPRKRAASEKPSFRSFPALSVAEGEKARPISFIGYKAGMTHIMGRDSHEKGSTFGQEINIPVTIVEAPPLKVFGIRAYKKAERGYGKAAALDVFAGSIDKALMKSIANFKKKSKKEKKGKGKNEKKQEGKEKNEEAKEAKGEKAGSAKDLDSMEEKLTGVVLLAHSQPGLCGFPRKRPDVIEIAVSGKPSEQLAFAKEILGKEIGIGGVFNELEFVDIKAVTKGKGMQGVVKRFGVRMQRSKAKKRRVVGSISPWNPSTVMWTVPRPGQMGYHSRTEYNKKILRIGSDAKEVNPVAGFKNYGIVKSDFIVLSGSVPGPAKRAVALRKIIRPAASEKRKIEGIDFIARGAKSERKVGVEAEEKLTQKIEVEKEEKQEKKSVQDEIAEAAGKKPETGKQEAKKGGKE